MAEILVNTNNPVKYRVFWRGEPTDADSLPTVKVYDITEDPTLNTLISPSTVLYTLTAEKLETDIGVYQVVLPLYVADKSKNLKLKWEYTVDSQSVYREQRLYVVTPYVDLQQACDCIGIGSDPSDPNYKTYNEILAAERWARKTIERYTGQKFYLYDDTEVVYGAGTDILPLPNKIHEVHDITENDILLVDYLGQVDNWGRTLKISESGFGIRVDRASMLDNTVYTANGMVPPSINDTYGGAFSRGSLYRISGRFGWEYVPDEVELACIELMKDYFSKDKQWRNKYVKNIKTFDWNFEYNGESFVGTGNMYVDQILESYVVTQMVVI